MTKYTFHAQRSFIDTLMALPVYHDFKTEVNTTKHAAKCSAFNEFPGRFKE